MGRAAGRIFGVVRSGRDQLVAFAVGGYITAAYWFTSSTSFANPAVTVGRTLSDTFAGIAPSSVPGFIAMQLIGVPPRTALRRRDVLGLVVVLGLAACGADTSGAGAREDTGEAAGAATLAPASPPQSRSRPVPNRG